MVVGISLDGGGKRSRGDVKLDVVEALQFMMCVYHQDLLFHEEPSTTLETEESFEGLGDVVRGEGGTEDEKGWDKLVGDLQDDEGFQDIDDDVFIQAIV